MRYDLAYKTLDIKHKSTLVIRRLISKFFFQFIQLSISLNLLCFYAFCKNIILFNNRKLYKIQISVR